MTDVSSPGLDGRIITKTIVARQCKTRNTCTPVGMVNEGVAFAAGVLAELIFGFTSGGGSADMLKQLVADTDGCVCRGMRLLAPPITCMLLCVNVYASFRECSLRSRIPFNRRGPKFLSSIDGLQKISDVRFDQEAIL